MPKTNRETGFSINPPAPTMAEKIINSLTPTEILHLMKLMPKDWTEGSLYKTLADHLTAGMIKSDATE